MSFVYITDLVKINSQDDLSNAPDWAMGSTNIGVMYGGFWVAQQQFNYGAWLCKLSNGALMGQTEEQIQSMAQSVPALARAKLIAVPEIKANTTLQRMVEKFVEDRAIIFARASTVSEEDDAGVTIRVEERTPVRDELTGVINHQETWVIVASEYVSGQWVEAVRLEDLVGALKSQHVSYNLTARGIETA